jgi:hypothetical protein
LRSSGNSVPFKLDVADEKLARGERLPELELRGPVEDFLPEPHESILARLAALPEDEQDFVFGMISPLIDIDEPRLRLSPEKVRRGSCDANSVKGV